MTNCGLGCWEKLYHGENVQPWGRPPEGLGEPAFLEGVQISAGQSHGRPDVALGVIQDGIESDFQRSLPAKYSWDDNLPVGICCGKT